MAGVRRTVAAALVVPPLVAFGCVLGVTLVERAGGTLFAAPPPANLAEAAALGRGDDVALRLHRGEDRFRVYDVRPEVISSAVRRATATEAAMWSRQLLMIQLLDRGGAVRDRGERLELACLAMDLGLDDVANYLASDPELACTPQQARDRVLARTTSGALR